MGTNIPIQNVYYLFCYAWQRFPEGQAIEVGATEAPEIVDLFARVLTNGLRRLLRRGLDRAYVEVEEETASLRGRIVLGASIRRNMLKKARAVCRFDELQHDVLHNQIIKASIRRLAEVDGLDRTLAHDLRALCRSMDGISDVRLARDMFRRVQLSRNTGHYDLLLKICELLHECLLPEEGGKRSKFADILGDEEKMSKVFEDFVRNFYQSEQTAFTAKSETIEWDAKAFDRTHTKYIPEMITDVSLRSSSRTIILDTKYYKETLSRYMGSEKIKAHNLYQIFSYLKNIERNGGPDEHAEGILLYPTVGQDLDLSYALGGHQLKVVTVNLDVHWTKIRERLLSIIDVVPSQESRPTSSLD